MSDLKTLQPAWAVPASVKVYSTTRSGGVSLPPFDSLNLGLHVGDDAQMVKTNRLRVKDALGFPAEPRWLKQVHGINVVNINTPDQPCHDKPADGAFTTKPNTVLAVMTADCLPVVIANAAGTMVAVAHAGWRGLANGILTKALAHFDTDEKLHAWLAPAIGPDTFEVGAEVLSAFTEKEGANEQHFKAIDNGKYMADLYGLAAAELKQGIQKGREVIICGGDHCTYKESNRFHSYRRDGVLSGRMATFAWISTP